MPLLQSLAQKTFTLLPILFAALLLTVFSFNTLAAEKKAESITLKTYEQLSEKEKEYARKNGIKTAEQYEAWRKQQLGTTPTPARSQQATSFSSRLKELVTLRQAEVAKDLKAWQKDMPLIPQSKTRPAKSKTTAPPSSPAKGPQTPASN